MAFDFSECVDNISNGRSKTVLGNVLYTSALLAIVAIFVVFWIFYSSMPSDINIYFKSFFYIFVAFVIILSLHYNTVSNFHENKYKNKALDDIMQTRNVISSEILDLDKFN